jgi:cellobiose dehydrogenase (acceptor)
MKVYITHGSQSVGSLGITADGATTFITNPHLTSDADKEAATIMMNRLIKMTTGENSTLTLIPPTGVTNVTGADLIKDFKTGSHYVGTAKMGTKGDAGVVVDTDTKVYGTDNLFVVDASFHPDLPTGNTQAIVMVAAEAAAARILALGKLTSNGTAPALPEASNSAAASSVTLSLTALIATPTGTGSFTIPSAAPIESASPVESSPASPPVQSAAPCAPAKSSPATTPTPSVPDTTVVQAYGRCGGVGYDGPTQCAAGWTCTKQNDYYSQCTQASKSRREPSSYVQKRSSRLRRRDGRLPISPEAFENDDVIARREKTMRASFLDTYDY